MNIVLRIAIFWFGSLLAQAIPIVLTIDDLIFFDDAVNELRPFRVATIATILSLMLPGTLSHLDRGEQFDHAGLGIFLTTSIVVLGPLLLLFVPSDLRYLSKSAVIWGFILTWWVCGGCNALHVIKLSQLAKQN